jgi:anti-sigma regulatory factor (Ser/Thr protein kinase)
MDTGPEDRETPLSLTIPAGPRTSTEARWFLLEALGERHPPERKQLAALLTSELASNAARHGSLEIGSPIEVRTEAQGEQLRVTVHDQGSGFDPSPVREGAGSGGLRLVDKLSSDWGVERSETGTDVWFEV